jgi:hypothetical protein
LHVLVQRAQQRCGVRAAALATAHGQLVDLARLLEAPADPATGEHQSGAVVRARVEAALADLATSCQDGGYPDWLRPALDHLVTVLRRLGDGLYHCYDVPGLPRTDNDLEHFYRRVKASERRITGRKRSDSFVVRVGGFAVYAITASATHEPQLRQRLALVPATSWLAARATLRANQERQTKMRRFRLHRAAYLADLEVRWFSLAEPG